MKTLALFHKAEDAHLLRARLEGSGIPAFVRDEHTMDGEIRVEIAEENFAAARAMIRNDKGILEAQHSPSKPGPRHWIRVFVLSAAGAFLVMALRNGAIAEPRHYVSSLVIGVAVGLLAVILSEMRRRSLR